MMKSLNRLLVAFALTIISLPSTASATIGGSGGSRFSLGGGLVYVNKQTSFALGAEYEYRVEPLYGIGAQANYVFSSEAFTMVSAPIFFLHPLLGDWYISAAPIFEFGSMMSTKVGARFTTRIPLDISILMFVPTFGVDLISGGPNYIFGLSIGI